MFIGILISALNDDDRNFVTEVYNKYGDRLYVTALDILKNEHDAEDAVHETMYKIIKYIDKYHGDNDEEIRNKILIVMRSSVYNTSCRYYRKKQKKADFEVAGSEDYNIIENIEAEDASDNPDEILIKKEDCLNVKEALLQLSPPLQDAVNLVYFCDFSCVEAANYLGITDSALRNRIFQAKKKLREVLRGEFDECNKK